MSSKKEEERNEKIIRGLMKLPPNRRCINCDSMGPQYVCTNFWTFICITCSGIHREFTHRVKSVSMAKFTSAEVEALQRGGNQRAREAFLNGWDEQKMRLPSSSNVDKIREFIKNVYVDKKYAGGRSFDKPPRETQSHKDHEDHRRANSYHSFSQSPPNEHQYEDRRYGKPTAVLSRKPGSDRGHEGKISSFLYSPGRPGEQMQEDRFANESGGSRISDYSLSSPVDPFRSAVQSPNSEGTGFNSPPQQVRDILIENARPQTLSTSSEANAKHDFDGMQRSQIQRTASASSYGSVDVNSASNFASLIDLVSGPEQTSGAKKAETAVFPSSHVSASAHSTNYDLFNLPVVKQNPLAPPVDLFASINSQDSFAASSNDKSFGVPFPEDVGWATFDLAHHLGPASGTNKTLPSGAPFGDEAPQGSTNTNPSISNNSQWLSVQSITSNRPPLMTDQWHTGLNEVKGPVSPKNSQSWNAFEDSSGNISQTSSALTQNGGAQFMGSFQSGYPKPDLGASSIGVNVSMKSVGGPSFALPVLPAPGGMPLERKPSNPFDFTYETDPEVNNMFMDMSSLQASLPNPQLPPTFLDGLSQPWFSQNSISTYVPSVAQGDLAYMAGQVSSSQLSNIPSQGPVASLGGNPFA